MHPGRPASAPLDSRFEEDGCAVSAVDTGPRPPRTLLFSQRHLDRLLSRCVSYEFEDVLCEIDDVEIVAPRGPHWFRWGNRVANQVAKRLGRTVNPGLVRIELDHDYDLFVAVCEFPWDLSALRCMPDWRRRSRFAVCWLEEIWPPQLRDLPGYLRVLRQFDCVILNCCFSVDPLRAAISRDCRYVPPGVDAIRFCPYPDPAPRSVYVYSLGRRSPVIHETLLKHAEREHLWYIYDTINIHDAKETDDHLSHRNLVANIAKRSRYFVANAAKINRNVETHGQAEVGFRFFEGAAAGTVMFGQPPETEAFRSLFGWADSVVRVPYDSPQVAKILADLDRQPERLAEISRNNVVNSLLRHDWLYRWRTVLDVAGLEPAPQFRQREARLGKLAALVRQQDTCQSITR
jgi:hypothetical protein